MNRTRSIFFLRLPLPLPPSPNLSPILLPIPHPPRSPISSLLIRVVIVIPWSSFSGRVLERARKQAWISSAATERTGASVIASHTPSFPLFLPWLPYAENTPNGLARSLPLSLHSPSGRGEAAREVGRSDLRTKREQKRLAHTHKSETLTPMFARVDLKRKNWRDCYAFKI